MHIFYSLFVYLIFFVYLNRKVVTNMSKLYLNVFNHEKKCHKQLKEFWKSWQMDQNISKKFYNSFIL